MHFRHNESIIRPAQPNDAEAVLALIEEHAEYEHEKIKLEGKLEPYRACLAMDTPPFHCLVVEFNGKVEGYCNYIVQFDSWTVGKYLLLDALYLRPVLRRGGIGNRLMQLLNDAAAKDNCETIRWQTPISNEIGQNFYRKIGADGQQKVFYSTPVKLQIVQSALAVILCATMFFCGTVKAFAASNTNADIAVSTVEADKDSVKCEIVNNTNNAISYSIKIEYNYISSTNRIIRTSKTIYGGIEPHVTIGSATTITGNHLHVDKIVILNTHPI